MTHSYKTIYVLPFILLSAHTYAQKNKEIRLGDPKGIVHDLAFYNDGNNLAIAEESNIILFETKNYKQTNELNGHSKTILSIDTSEDDKFLVSAGRDSTVLLWDLRTFSVLEKLHHHNAIITSVLIHENLIVSGGTDNQIIIFDYSKKKILHTLKEHTDHVLDLAFDQTNDILASSGADGRVIFWNLESGDSKKDIETNSFVRGISIFGPSKKLIYCSDNGNAAEWNINRDQISNTYKLGSNWLTDIDFKDDGKSFATGDIRGGIKIIYPFGEYKLKVSSPISTVAFKPNEKQYLKVAIGTLGKGVFIVDGREMKHKRQ